MKIFGWSGSIKDGCYFYRMKMPLEEMRARGHQVAIGTHWTHPEFKNPDVLVAQRVCMPGPTSEFLRRSDVYRVYELDDDLMNVPDTNPGFFLYSDPEIQNNIKCCIQAADAVTVSTEKLGEMVSKLNGNVHVIPNTVHSWLLDYNRKRNERLTIGWAGSGTHHLDWSYNESPIRRFLERDQRVEFHEIGADYGSSFRLGNRYRNSKWVEGTENLWKSIDFDVGLGPLKPHIFNRSKSPIKALEYGVLGIPIVASDFGPYSAYVEHGVTGWLVKRDHEWSKYLYALVNDPHMRESMGRQARELASKFTLDKHMSSWGKAYAPS